MSCDDNIRQTALDGGSSLIGIWTYEPLVESRSGPYKQTCSSRTVASLEKEQFSDVPGQVRLSWQHWALDALPQNNQKWKKNNLMSCISRPAIFTFKSLISCSLPRYNQYHWMDMMSSGCKNKQTQIWTKRTHTALHKMLVPLWGGNKSAQGEWERVRRWLCLQASGSWLVGSGSPNGHRFWGLRVLSLFEKDLWSRIKVIYLRTPDGGPWALLVFETVKWRDTESERGRVGRLKREPGVGMVGGEEKKNYV